MTAAQILARRAARIVFGLVLGVGICEIAVASLHAFCSGLFSADPRQPFRADADALSLLTDAALA